MKERGDIAVGGDEYTFSITSSSGLETKPVGVENAHTYVHYVVFRVCLKWRSRGTTNYNVRFNILWKRYIKNRVY